LRCDLVPGGWNPKEPGAPHILQGPAMS